MVGPDPARHVRRDDAAVTSAGSDAPAPSLRLSSVLGRPRRAVEIGGVLLVAVLTWLVHRPGVFGYDSLVQWYEGQTGRYRSNQPPMLGFLWELLDRIGSGPSLLMLISCLCFCCGAYLIFRFKAPSAVAFGLLVLLELTPPVFAQISFLNKESLACHLMLLAFGLSLHASRPSSHRRLVWPAALLNALAVVIRYQYVAVVGVLFAGFALPMLRWREARTLWNAARAGLHACAIFAVAILAMVLLINTQAQVDWRAPVERNWRNQLAYDLAAIIAGGGVTSLDLLAAAGVDPQLVIRESIEEYTPESNVPMAPQYATLNSVPIPVLDAQVAALAREHPWRLLRHRLATFSWLIGLHDVCGGVQQHIIRPLPGTEEAQLAAVVHLGNLEDSLATSVFTSRLFPANTFLFRPFVYLILAAACLAWMLARRSRRESFRLMIGLPVSGIIYTLTFLPITPACDFRYLYWLVLSSLICLGTLLSSTWMHRQPTA